METLETKENQIVFSANIEDSLANAIRRYISQISILAIDEVDIAKNDSALYDETLAHRIGLVPIKTGKIVSDKKEFKIELKSKEARVYSGEIKGEAEVVHDKILLTILDKGQSIEIEGVVKAGKGADHSKFSPGFMTYRNSCEITLDKKFKDEIKKIFPNSDIKDKGDKIIVSDNKKQEVADLCEGLADKEGQEAEVKLNDDLIIQIESFGQIDVKDIFGRSITALKKDLEAVGKGLK
jgi:DNA-directed RNA polymerase subunit D